MANKLSPIQAIRKLALYNIDNDSFDTESVLDYLKRWWCLNYNRPYKDPVLGEYTLEELLLEYFEVNFSKNPSSKKAAIEQIYNLEHAEEDEEDLKELMGDNYMSAEEMKELFSSKGE